MGASAAGAGTIVTSVAVVSAAVVGVSRALLPEVVPADPALFVLLPVELPPLEDEIHLSTL